MEVFCLLVSSIFMLWWYLKKFFFTICYSIHLLYKWIRVFLNFFHKINQPCLKKKSRIFYAILYTHDLIWWANRWKLKDFPTFHENSYYLVNTIDDVLFYRCSFSSLCTIHKKLRSFHSFSYLFFWEIDCYQLLC